MTSIGLLYGKLTEYYSEFCSSLAGYEHNFIGLYYRDCVILFRIFDGSIINYLSNEHNYHFLITNRNIKTLYRRDFNLSQIKTDLGLTPNKLCKLIEEMVTNVLCDIKDDYNDLLNSYIFSKYPVNNGYYIINNILGKCCNLDIDGESSDKKLYCDYYLDQPVESLIHLSDESSDSNSLQDEIDRECDHLYQKLYTSLRDILINNPDAITAFKSLNFNMDFDDLILMIESGNINIKYKIKLLKALSPLIREDKIIHRYELEKDINCLGEILNDCHQNNILDIKRLHQTYLSLCSQCECDPIELENIDNTLSCNGIFNYHQQSENIKFEGITINVTNPDLSQLSYGEVLDLLKQTQSEDPIRWKRVIDACIRRIAPKR